MKKGFIISLLLTIVYGGIVYYLFYPPINITYMGFWIFLFSIIIVYVLLSSIFTMRKKISDYFDGKRKDIFKEYKILFVIPIVILGIILINFIFSPLFQANQYYKRIKIDDGNFSLEIHQVDFNKLPLLDRDSSLKIGDRTMGQMSEVVSQFDVSDEYTQINYHDEIIRVTPLEYHGFIKWMMNRNNGIKGYITVNSTTGKAKLIKLKKGMKYAPSAYFNENLSRKLQMSYPTMIFDSVNFEIDNDGNPYWVASVIKYVGVGIRREVIGVVIFDPITGKSKYYNLDKVPSWVDHVYEADLILEQVNDWGRYKNGFFNSVIGQKGVVETTTGYNYLAQDDDVYLYTGITSVISDEANIGFVLTNMRTKETKFYDVAGAEEYSAMDSAKGQVQQMHYTSTFPLLINLNGRPTYLISLKDNAGLVKMYAFVDVVDYQKVVVTDSSQGIVKASENYLNELGEVDNNNSNIEKEITIKNIRNVIIDGNTYYYIEDIDDKKYKISIKVDKDKLPFVKEGDKLIINYKKEEEVINISKIIG